ncbi:ROK family protein [Ruficoccus amylovorans]|uniref:ROK family protein n=1 Tax=Ruficoccus amylovorans TaxID=1804625 RepID=A0A842H9I7_9BACT|nr:ROK family protein [Ruficoccus amylovorans]MBC2593173.1 ROK family protein [Ruficoccus amylovorans]
MFELKLLHTPELDPGFIPASLWNQHYRDLAYLCPDAREVTLQVVRPDGQANTYRTRLLPANLAYAGYNLRYCERLVKMMLWAWGGCEVRLSGAPEIAAKLKTIYSPEGERAFDWEFMGQRVFLQPFSVHDTLAPECADSGEPAPAKRNIDGCRIGFDLGGSDRKCAALIDGEVVYSEEIKWSPYFESDPEYHIAGIQDSLERAAAHLPRVDAIGGSAAGIYIDNEPRVASLFRGVSAGDFEAKIRPLFHELKRKWENVPFVVANDGDVTALAGAHVLGVSEVLGLSMGTSQAVGYVNGAGAVTGWLNELAFAPVDYREQDSPRDEWSGDRGCGVQYFSQQAVSRLLPASGLPVPAEMPMAEQLEAVQSHMERGDQRAAAIYRTIGTCLGYALAHYADFYRFRHLLFLGRVSSGEGGQIIREQAEDVLGDEFPSLAPTISITLPDETMKRHGQAVAAASLPVLDKQSASTRL